MKNLYPFLRILAPASGASLCAQSDARPAPQLTDSGVNLRPGYVKP